MICTARWQATACLMLATCVGCGHPYLRLRYEPASEELAVDAPANAIVLRVRDDRPPPPKCVSLRSYSHEALFCGYLPPDLFMRLNPVGLQRTALRHLSPESDVPTIQAVIDAFRRTLCRAGYKVKDEAPFVYEVSLRACCYAVHDPLGDNVGMLKLGMGVIQCDVSLIVDGQRAARLRLTKRTKRLWFIGEIMTSMASDVLSRCLSELVDEAVMFPPMIAAIERETAARVNNEHVPDDSPRHYRTVRIPYGEETVPNQDYTISAVQAYHAKKYRNLEVLRYHATSALPFGTGILHKLMMRDEVQRAKSVRAKAKAKLSETPKHHVDGDFWEERVRAEEYDEPQNAIRQ